MKIATVVFLLLLMAMVMVIVSQRSATSTYTVDLGIEYLVAEFVSTEEVYLEWRDGGHRSGESVESLMTLTNGQPVHVQALMRNGLFGLWPARTVRMLAQPAQ